MVTLSTEISQALKEWAIAVEALSTSKTIVLLRKGGIREADFQVQQSYFWLYPTYEHQKPHLLKPEYSSQVTPVKSGWHPKEVIIKNCAKITEAFTVNSREQIELLQPYHIWHEQMIRDRFDWQPQRPLTVLLLRVYHLVMPKTIPYHSAYGGCKSWINLIEPIAADSLNPIMSDTEYNARAKEITARALS